MKATLLLRLRMYLAVKCELQAIVNSVGNAGLSALLDVFNANIEKVPGLHDTQTLLTQPQTGTRDKALGDMTALALVVAGPLGAHAHQQGLLAAEAVADVNATTFNRLRILERPVFAQKIHDAALPLVVALTPLGVTEAMLGDLQAKIDAAREILNEPRTTIIDRHRATENLTELFAAIDLLLEKQIDRALAPLQLTHPELHARYFEARKAHRRASHATEEPETATATTPATAPAAVAAPPPAAQAAA